VVSGTVTDENNQPLEGASVLIQGAKTAIGQTNSSGSFTVSVPARTRALVFSYVGKQSQSVTLGDNSTLKVVLMPETSNLNDVVVIGYGTQKRGDINSSVASISAKDIANIPQSSLDQQMQGKLPGVTITNNSGQPGAAVSVMVRGITSFSGTQPLYVIDGVVIDGNASQSTNSNQANGLSPTAQEATYSVLGNLNPDDVASIDVLKDASATAIYGSRGANGVIIITTKKGKMGTGTLGYNGFWGEQTQGKFLDMMNLPQYAAYQNELASLFNSNPRPEFTDPSKLGPGTNWQKAVFRHAPEQSHTINFSGANEKTNFYVSGGYFQQDGTILGSNYNRFSFHTSVNSQLKSWLKVGTSISANRNKTNVGLGDQYGIIYNALLQAPDAAVYNADGSFAGPALVNGVRQGGANPVQQALSITNYLTRSNMQGNMYADVTFVPGLTLHSEMDGNFDWGTGKIFNPTYSYGATGSDPAFTNPTAVLLESNSSNNYWNWQEYLSYNHTFAGKHNVSAMVGREVWRSGYDNTSVTIQGFTAGNTIQTLNMGDNTTAIPNESQGSTSMESYMARLVYTYDNKYSITASDRRDRSSNFAPGHQVGYFPGVAVSWKISEEPFMKSVNKTVSNLKLRVGYGTTGNANVPQYAYGSAINAIPTGLGQGFLFSNFSNPSLSWETAQQTNIGLDFGLMNNRIVGNFDWYNKTSKNFLMHQPLPGFLGGAPAESYGGAVISSPWVNAGNINNKGFEISITSRNMIKKDFTWTTNVVFSHYSNKIISLNGFPSIIQIINTGNGGVIQVTNSTVGGPVGEFYGYKIKGMITTESQLQNLAAHPQNVVGKPEVVSSDRTNASGIYLGDFEYEGNNDGNPNTQYALGNPNPKFTYSMTNTFTYKGFELTIFLNGAYGGKIFNALATQTMGMNGLYKNQLADVVNYWTPQNPTSNIPAPRAGDNNNNIPSVITDRFLESGSYLRIQNVRIGYNLPTAWAKKIAMSSLKAYVSGQNIYTFTKYSGLDPEVGALNQDPTLQNIDYGRYPMPRVITVGLNVEF
jgi:TonB-linked SusC/RagA family outer membrane protein